MNLNGGTLLGIRATGLVGLTGLLAFACFQSFGQAKPKPLAPSFAKDVKPVITKFCVSCHSGDDAAASLNLEKLVASADFVGNLETWGKVLARINSRQMPPTGNPQPTDTVRGRLVNWIETKSNEQCRLADPGRVTIRRLNREEYNNTIRDLTGLTLRPADDFPSDDVGYGFDNIGDVLSVSSLLMEKYIRAAEIVGNAAIPTGEDKVRRYAGTAMSAASGAHVLDDGGMFFSTNAESVTTVDLRRSGSYTFHAYAGGDLAGSEDPIMAVDVDGKRIAQFKVANDRKHPKSFECPVSLTAGKHKVGVGFTNDYYNLKDPPGRQDRNLWVGYFELRPVSVAPAEPSPAELRIIPHPPAAGMEERDARSFIAKFAGHAFRRPATPEELDRLMKLYAVGTGPQKDFRAGVKLAIEATLASPNFLFRVELDPRDSAGKVRALTDYELASRLSYFLWSSMPDDELFGLARQGRLHQMDVLNAQVQRMLADSKANALADNFAGQWLQLRKLAIVFPDTKRFPGIDDRMKNDMATETKMFFEAVMRDNRPITDFIDGKYTFLDQRLADLYGIEGVTGDQFRRVPLTGDRGGVLTQASVLLVTSNPTRTSPTKRGKWVLEQILGTPPPPPPPGVGQIADEQHKIDAKTLRQLMEEHRKNPMCAACHAKMDPIGFGLENFDAVGRWRTKDGEFPLDTTGTLPDGESFKGPGELKKILLRDKKEFAHALAEKLLTYALGRGPGPSDTCALDAITKEASTQDDRLASLIIDVVDSDPFRKRTAENSK